VSKTGLARTQEEMQGGQPNLDQQNGIGAKRRNIEILYNVSEIFEIIYGVGAI